MIAPADEEGEARPFSIVDAIISIPRTVISIFEVSPPESPGSNSQDGATGTVINVRQEGPETSATDSVKVVVLEDGTGPEADTVKVSEAVRQEVVITDAEDQGRKRDESANTGEYRGALPETTIGNTAEITEGRLICPPDYLSCNGVCRNVSADSNNCGSCGNTCQSGSRCTLGACTPICSDSLTYCDGACVDLLADANNCGACGNVCVAGAACGNGQCVARMVTTQQTLQGNPGIRKF